MPGYDNKDKPTVHFPAGQARVAAIINVSRNGDRRPRTPRRPRRCRTAASRIWRGGSASYRVHFDHDDGGHATWPAHAGIIYGRALAYNENDTWGARASATLRRQAQRTRPRATIRHCAAVTGSAKLQVF
jgi:hypothetical protein